MDGEAVRSSTGKAAIGFLTVVEHPQHGLFGGYLVLNESGRPLEFHCTAPVKPSRAQEILYGPTLRPYLYGEQIGGALINKAKVRPAVVCTDVAPILSLRDFTALPVALVAPSETPEETPVASPTDSGARFRVDAGHPPVAGLHQFTLGQFRLTVPVSHAADRTIIARHLAQFAERLDLCEPFSRIREAIDEAQRGSGR